MGNACVDSMARTASAKIVWLFGCLVV